MKFLPHGKKERTLSVRTSVTKSKHELDSGMFSPFLILDHFHTLRNHSAFRCCNPEKTMKSVHVFRKKIEMNETYSGTESQVRFNKVTVINYASTNSSRMYPRIFVVTKSVLSTVNMSGVNVMRT